MKKLTILITAFTLLSCGNKSIENTEQKASNSRMSLTTGEVEKLAGEFGFTEGPAVDIEGNIYFADIPNSIIFIWTIDNQLDTFTTNSGNANGLYFDDDQNLLACVGELGQIAMMGHDGVISTVVAGYEGNRFNQTNDLWLDGKGGVYVTDPKYGDEENLPQEGMNVYYLKPDHSSVIKVCDDYEKPNGIIGTPDGKILYVTDAQAGFTYKYDIQENGKLENKVLFAKIGSDGMTIDKDGNIYLTPAGKHSVDIYSPAGEFLESIEVPEGPANICFGGKERNQLFITARTSLYRVMMDTKGVD